MGTCGDEGDLRRREEAGCVERAGRAESRDTAMTRDDPGIDVIVIPSCGAWQMRPEHIATCQRLREHR